MFRFAKSMAIAALGLFISSGAASAATVAQVGSVDTLLGSGSLSNSNPATELQFIRDTANNQSLVFLTKIDNNPFTQVTDAAGGIVSAEISESTTHFLVKTGNVTTSGNTDFVFANIPSLGYAVIDIINQLGIANGDITGISHLTLATRIPAALLLLLTAVGGLFGFGWLRRREEDEGFATA